MVTLIGDHTALKKAGSSWKGLSPFAAEKTPSFYVHPDKGFFYCFSTNQGGDIFRFLMLKEGMNFQESVERVAARFGIPLQYEQGGLTQEDRTLRAQLLALHETAAAHYATAFRDDDAHARQVRDYWTNQRRFTLDTAGQFQIGFAPVDGGGLARLLLKNGYTKEALGKSGLFVGMDYSPDPLRWRPRFRGRLMIPIRDVQGRVIAFTARQLALTPTDDPSHEAKYVNSPETEIFHKSHILFNLDKARKAANDDTPIVLVEGQLDAIRAYTCGVATAVASQGTAIGAEHLALVRRYTRRVDALLDADRAGQAAALKLLPLAFQAGVEVRVLHVPGGKDPDEYFAAAGAAGWPAVRDNAAGAIAFAVRGLLPPGESRSTAQKLDALQSLFAIIAQADSAVVRDEALREVCQRTALDLIAVQRDFQRFLQGHRPRPSEIAPAPGADTTAGQFVTPPLTTAEDALLILLLQHESFTKPLAELIHHEWIETSNPSGQLLDRILVEIEHGEWQGVESAYALAETAAENNRLAQILAESVPIPDPRAQANACLAAMFKRFAKKRRLEIATAIAALPPGNPDALRRLQEEEIHLRKTLQHPPRLS